MFQARRPFDLALQVFAFFFIADVVSTKVIISVFVISFLKGPLRKVQKSDRLDDGPATRESPGSHWSTGKTGSHRTHRSKTGTCTHRSQAWSADTGSRAHRAKSRSAFTHWTHAAVIHTGRARESTSSHAHGTHRTKTRPANSHRAHWSNPWARDSTGSYAHRSKACAADTHWSNRARSGHSPRCASHSPRCASHSPRWAARHSRHSRHARSASHTGSTRHARSSHSRHARAAGWSCRSTRC